ncbi:MAG: NDP-sugar synthase [Dehalococcoidales bacterium]|nr:NDP-sugar synthase [Dehalococcoidales bacterium]
MSKTDMLSKAVILVGGQGTRLQPLTFYLPKPMLPVLNHPFLEHTICYLKGYGVGDITLALNYLPEAIRDCLGNGSRLGVSLNYAVEDDPLGTAGAVKNAERYLDSTFAVLNGDIFTDLDITGMFAFHRSRRAKVTIALSWVDDPSAFGVVETDSDGRVKCFTEKPSPDRITSHWINAGTYIVEPEVLEHIPPNRRYMFERGLFPLLLELGEPVYGYPDSGYWLDMGTPEKYLRLNFDLLLNKVSSYLMPGLDGKSLSCEKDVAISPSAGVTGPVVIGSGVRIDRGASVTGPVVIGAGCCLGEGAVVEQAVLWNGVNVGVGAVLKRCIVGAGCTIADGEQVADCVVTKDENGLLGKRDLTVD